MKALTIRDPWAELIARGVKPVENRKAGTGYRGPLAIHVSRTLDTPATVRRDVVNALGSTTDERLTARATMDEHAGLVIAVADLVDVHESDGICCGPWAQHRYDGRVSVQYMRHLVLANVRRLAWPVAARGALGLWNIEDELIEAGGVQR